MASSLNSTAVRKALAILLFIAWPLVLVSVVIVLLGAWFVVPFGYMQKTEDGSWSWRMDK